MPSIETNELPPDGQLHEQFSDRQSVSAKANGSTLPAIRACVFDMDGLLINSEDVITQATNQVLEKYKRPHLPSSIRAQLMGIPHSTNSDLFHSWAKLPISRDQWASEIKEQMRLGFPACKPLPGAEQLLSRLRRARSATGDDVELALASTTNTASYKQKTTTPEAKRVLGFFHPDRRVLGDNPRARRSKPAPDMYLLALELINSGGKGIKPEECLVFEDSVVGVEAGRRAGMRVVWVPHADVAVYYQTRQQEVLAGRVGLVDVGDDWQLGEIDDGWAESIPSLEHFDYSKYGIHVPQASSKGVILG